MAPIPDDSTRSDLERILAMLRRRRLLIGLCLLGTTVTALGFSLLQEKEYSASASLLFRNPGFAEDLFGTTSAPATVSPTREAATNQKLVGLKIVGKRAARHLKGLSQEDVSEMVGVSSEGEADVVSVTATSPDPQEAQRVANTFARQFIAFRAGTDRSKLLEAKRLAEREYEQLSTTEKTGVRGRALSRGAEKLGILASLQTGNAELVQPAELPSAPSSPKPLRNTIVGAILGLLLGLGSALMLERLNRRLRDPEEAIKAFELPVLATIPESKAIMASNEGAPAQALPFAETEAFRMLRASLRYFNVDRELRSILITSHGAEVGKSTVAWNLACVAAASSKTIIVETDLRNPSLARQHGLRLGPGLAELLTHQADLPDAIQSKSLATSSKSNGHGGNLDIIVSGANPPNPAELIESQTMIEVLAQLAERYDLVVIDTAPVGVVSDAFPLLRQVDGVLAVARIDKTTRDGAEQIREKFRQLEAPAIGVVANGIKSRGGKYGYGYYGRYQEAKPADGSINGAKAATGSKANDHI